MRTRLYTIFTFVFLTIYSLVGQNNYEFLVIAGPSITNIREYWNGEQVFFAFPERPFHRVTGHGGVGIEKPFGLVTGRVALLYEKVGSSSVGFNKDPNEFANFLTLPISVLLTPVKNRPIKLEFGSSIEFLLKSSEIVGKKYRTFGVSLLMGIEYEFIQNASFNIKWLESLNSYSKGSGGFTNPLLPMIERKLRTQSFQFSLIYKI